ncbi:MAG: ABC transporter permease, partial [Deltaproteobacteria bacterium]|nr:ABC transporter permease [Deltaproteobacteria bacterium]
MARSAQHPADPPPTRGGEQDDAGKATQLETGHSLWSDAWRRLKKNRPAVASAVILGAMLAGCILVPELSQWNYTRADLSLGPTPP